MKEFKQNSYVKYLPSQELSLASVEYAFNDISVHICSLRVSCSFIEVRSEGEGIGRAWVPMTFNYVY